MDLTIIAILISLISPLVAIYLDYKNKKFVADIATQNELLIHKIYKEKINFDNIEKVLTEFMDMYNASRDTGISALIKSGVASIDNEEHIKYVITEIQNRTGKNPLGKYSEQIAQVGLLNFFKNTNLQSYKDSGGIENIIEKLNDNKK
jgi:hypothetical protein